VTGRRVLLGLMAIAYALFGLLGIAVLAPNTFVGADLTTFQQAGQDLWLRGDPYASAASQGYNFQYRYPPLLAMLMPVLGWPPLWFALLGASTALVFYFWWRDAGWLGLLPIVMLAGAWAQVLINGNAQPILMALLAVTPRFARAGAVSLAVATMLKLHPVLGLIWYAGRRDWRALRWYAGAMIVLLALQAPWLPDMARYYLDEPSASQFAFTGWGLRLAGDWLWLAGAALTGFLAYRYANRRYGWMLNIVFQLAAMPRLLPTNLALLLAAPIRSRSKRRSLATAHPDRPDARAEDALPAAARVEPLAESRLRRVQDVVDLVVVQSRLRVAR